MRRTNGIISTDGLDRNPFRPQDLQRSYSSLTAPVHTDTLVACGGDGDETWISLGQGISMEDILRILEEDARTTPERIATMTGRPVDEVRRLVNEAERARVILSYSAHIDWDKAGEAPVAAALIEVKVAPQRDVGFNALAGRIARFPEVRSMHLVSGNYDLLVQVVGKSIYDISNFVSGKLSALDGVRGTNTHFILKRYKEDGTLMVGDDSEDERLPISL
jgi:DNA-binding Lrp family transcriptional regulator